MIKKLAYEALNHPTKETYDGIQSLTDKDFTDLCLEVSNKAARADFSNVTKFVRELPRRLVTVFWCVFIRERKDLATEWYFRNVHNANLICNALFCRCKRKGYQWHDVMQTEQVYEAKVSLIDWLFHTIHTDPVRYVLA